MSELILKEANRQNLDLKNDTINIGFRIDEDGTTAILDNQSNNKELKRISRK